MIKKWTKIFKILGNENRLKIIKILYPTQELAVGEIADQINLSLKATSKHLINLANLDILQSRGKNGQVYYSISSTLEDRIKKIIHESLL